MFIVNKKVAVTPFETHSITIEVKNGLPVIKQKQELTKLTVVFGTDASLNELWLHEGDTVWVRGDAMKHQYAREVFEQDGKPFILLPLEMIVSLKRREA